MRVGIRRLIACMLACLITLCTSVIAFAAEESIVATIRVMDVGNIESDYAEATKFLEKHIGTAYALNTDTQAYTYQYYFRMHVGTPTSYLYMSENFYALSHADQLRVMSTFVDDLRNDFYVTDGTSCPDVLKQLIYTSLSRNVRGSIATELPSIFQMTSANVGGGMALISLTPFRAWYSWLLGILCIAITAWLVFTTIMDLCYIGNPGLVAVLTKPDGTLKAFAKVLVSRDAVSVSEAHLLGHGQSNPYLAYLKTRAATYVILSLCILYLLSGKIADLISSLLHFGETVTGIG